jgi:hypothetical protein
MILMLIICSDTSCSFRSQRVSTALVTNIDFEAWGDYLGGTGLQIQLTGQLFVAHPLAAILARFLAATDTRKTVCPRSKVSVFVRNPCLGNTFRVFRVFRG